MTDAVTYRYRLAMEAVSAAFTVIARHAASSGTMDIIDMNRRLHALGEGDEGSLRRTLESLNNIAGSPHLLAFRSVTFALTQSLPKICSAEVTVNDIRIAALDLRQLALEAESLRATDVAVKLAATIQALLNQIACFRLSAAKDRLH
jgi:hypothetical protein